MGPHRLPLGAVLCLGVLALVVQGASTRDRLMLQEGTELDNEEEGSTLLSHSDLAAEQLFESMRSGEPGVAFNEDEIRGMVKQYEDQLLDEGEAREAGLHDEDSEESSDGMTHEMSMAQRLEEGEQELHREARAEGLLGQIRYDGLFRVEKRPAKKVAKRHKKSRAKHNKRSRKHGRHGKKHHKNRRHHNRHKHRRSKSNSRRSQPKQDEQFKLPHTVDITIANGKMTVHRARFAEVFALAQEASEGGEGGGEGGEESGATEEQSKNEDDPFCRKMHNYLLSDCTFEKPSDPKKKRHCNVVMNTWFQRCLSVPGRDSK